MASDVPMTGLNAPLKIYCLALAIFDTFSRFSYLCWSKICPREKWLALKIMKFKAWFQTEIVLAITSATDYKLRFKPVDDQSRVYLGWGLWEMCVIAKSHCLQQANWDKQMKYVASSISCVYNIYSLHNNSIQFNFISFFNTRELEHTKHF